MSAMKCTLLSLLAMTLMLVIIGCTDEEILRGTNTAAAVIGAGSKIAPPQFSWIGYLLSGLLTSVPPLIYGAIQRKKKMEMKGAIKTTAKIIDTAKHSDVESLAASAKAITAYIGKIKALDNPGAKKDLDTFNAVREGLI